ncbi:capsular biosynthesis protein, partial [Helicobacter monodelphidis]|uniref:glycosyltransferase family 4 protein n=1 Tax=Helicobacter sp. 15-1451 TaxID=2004995 RepID=UPI000DCE26A0
MKRILILHFHNHQTQPRLRREYDLLCEKYRLTGLGYVDCKREYVEFITIQKPKWTLSMKWIQRFWLFWRCFERVYWNLPQIKEADSKLEGKEFDIILAHNEESLPLALKHKKNAKIIANMHEYAPREFEHSFWWRFYFSPYKHWLCKTYLPQADIVYTVCNGLAEEYSKNYGITCGVITSAAKYYAPPPKGLSSHETIKLIYHGMAGR